MRHVMIMIAVLCTLATADIPQMMSYQGKVTDAGGSPLADGPCSMQFLLFEQETGGSPVWDSGAQTVGVMDGIFSVLLGGPPQPPIGYSFVGETWLEVTIGSDVQTPRVRLGSVGYAYMASGLVPGTEVIGPVGDGSLSALKGVNTATAGYTYGGLFESDSPNGLGVLGRANATTGDASGGYFTSRATGGRGVVGLATSTTGTVSGVYGRSESTSGRGVYGMANATEGVVDGVRGETRSDWGRGVVGTATAATGPSCGVYGEAASTDGRGVYGMATATTGQTYGARGQSASGQGMGVYGFASATAGYNYGGRFESLSANGIGVAGSATATSGDARGGYFICSSIEGRGVVGLATATTGLAHGVYGRSDSEEGRGVFGVSTATQGMAYGVYGASSSSSGCGVSGMATAINGQTQGVRGQTASEEGMGVYGHASAESGSALGVCGVSYSSSGSGVRGVGPFCGVQGESGEGDGTRGFSYATNKSGVYGMNSLINGVAYGVYGRTYSSWGYGVYYEGGLAGSGTKSCVVKTSQGPTLMYCQESPENWFEDFGEGQLVDGRCHVELDPLFLETVTIDGTNPMKVFVELGDDCNGVFVQRSVTGFDVVELHRGTSAVPFVYRVVGKRAGYETKRLDYCKAAEKDAHLYPELREGEERFGLRRMDMPDGAPRRPMHEKEGGLQ